MKKVFEDDSSYIEIIKSSKKDHLILSLCARDYERLDRVTMISIEIDSNELQELIKKELENDE